MKKAVWGAFLLMTTLAAAGLCETDYTLSNPHIRYEKIEGARQEEAAQADGAGISLSDMAAAEDAQSAAQSADTWPKTFTVTLGGDTTLGSTDDLRKREDCFENVAADKGYGWFFSGLQTLFATDDLTLVNFEGTLTEETSKKEKLYNFKGPAEYTDILTLGSVEAVNIANNHYIDFGGSGRESTRAALEAAGIGFSGYTYRSVVEVNGYRIGFAGCRETVYLDRKAPVYNDLEALREAGCDAIIYSFHWGKEYSPTHNQTQRRMADYAIEHGADIVVGTHPHCVQGVEHRRGSLILWSLGNLVFGGTHEMTTFDAVVAQVSLCFEDGAYQGAKLRLLPVLTSSARPENNFQPEWAEGEDYERIMGLIQDDSEMEIESEMWFPAG